MRDAVSSDSYMRFPNSMATCLINSVAILVLAIVPAKECLRQTIGHMEDDIFNVSRGWNQGF